MKKYDPKITEALDKALAPLGPIQQHEFLRQAFNRYASYKRNTKSEHVNAYKRRYYAQPDVKEKNRRYYEEVVKPRRNRKRLDRYIQRMEEEDNDT